MDQITCAPSSNTSTGRESAPQVSEVLRPVGIPLAPLRIAPRPAEPTQRLTARPFAWPEDGEADAPIERALGAYGYDRFQHAADRAFGEDLPGGAA